jgi:hypothetical protein
MNINEPKMEDTSKFINKTYDNLSYFDLYGNSVFIFIIVTLLVFAVFSYCKIMETKEDIANDWINQRCKPQNMLFAGLITKPDGVSAFQYTSDNFQYCVQNILTNISGYALQPFQYMLNSLTQVFTGFLNSIQQTRGVISKLRTNVRTFAEDLLGRVLNVMVPMQKIFISLMDVFQKIQGTMTAGLYTMLGTYYTLQALMGAILELIIKVLIALVIIIVGLWILPFTWPAAASMTAVFLSISVPLAIIIYFMTEVLHIKSSAIPKLRCFDAGTMISLLSSQKPIADVQVGDVLSCGAKITAKIKVCAKSQDLYDLNGVIVSGTHLVKYGNKWIRIEEHPIAKKLTKEVDYLYCLNTSNNIIELNGNIFSDWDESVLTNKYINLEQFDIGFDKNTLIDVDNNGTQIKISDIKIGDTLRDNSVVYGIVELRNNYLHILTNNGNLFVSSKNVKDYNYIIDNFII